MDENRNKERFWELATLRIHKEATEEELDELELFLQNEIFQNLYAEIEQLNSDVKKTKPLSHVSQINSWNQISKTRRQKNGKTSICDFSLRCCFYVCSCFRWASFFVY